MSYEPRDRARFVGEDPAQKSGDRDDFARDRARIVHSASLRRLATKTQVLQPDADEFIRNRLTHSLEVAQIGREIAQVLGCNADVVDAACLSHDLGHPPFGHNGETALDALTDEIGGFEGNAQTFRLLTRLEAKRVDPTGRSVGLNLTRATLDAVCKYPWMRGGSPYPTVKFNCYADDADLFDWVREGAPEDRRCLEAQVMDWADDIAYSVHDVEDGVTAGLIDLRVLDSPQIVDDLAALAQRLYAPQLEHGRLVEAAHDLWHSGAVPQRKLTLDRDDTAALKDMTSRLIGFFAKSAEKATRARFGDGDLTRFDADLVVPDAALAECAILKATAARYVMLTEERSALMATQRDDIDAIVAHLVQHPEELDPIFRQDHDAATDDAGRLRVVVDQVASMTDLRARSTAAQLR